MKYYAYRESAEHRTNGLPIAFYQVEDRHPRYEMMHHWHREYELIYVLSGTLHLTMETAGVVLHTSEFALVNPGVLHSGRPNRCRYECVVFDADALTRGLLNLHPNGRKLLSQTAEIMPFSGPGADAVRPHVEGLFAAMRRQKPGFELEAVSHICGFFAAVLQNDLSVDRTAAAPGRAAHLAPLERAIAYMEKQYQHPISLEEMAAQAGFSRKYFSDYFKKMTGKTPIEYLNCYRIERACELLLETELPVTRIALDCGFNDLSYFIKTFREQKATTPGHYRRTAAVSVNFL